MTTHSSSRARGRPYTPAEDAIIRKHYPQGGAVGCAEHLDRSVGSITGRASHLGIKFTPPPRRPKAGQRSDRDVHFSRDSLMPTSIEELGRKREYPRVQPLGEPCPVHPSSTIGAWGKCPACESGNRWSKQQRETAFRPHHEGGR